MSVYNKLSDNVDTFEGLLHEATKPCIECGHGYCKIIVRDKDIVLKCADCGNERVL